MRRVTPLLVLLLLLVGGGYFLVTRLLFPPEARACARFAELCGEADNPAALQRCEEMFVSLSQAAGQETVDRALLCVQRSTSCAKAVGCLVGAGGSSLGEFFKGLSEGLLER